MQGYVVAKGSRYYAVIYEGIDPLTGRDRRRWHPAGVDRDAASQLASRLAVKATPSTCVGGRPLEIGVKTRTSRRCIDLDATTLDQLEKWRQRLVAEGNTHDPSDWMFCNERGRHLNPETASQLFARIVTRTTLPRIRFHDLRHTHASLLIAAGVPIKVVSERLGHAHPAFTMHTYQHVLPGMSAAAANTFAALIATANR